MSCTLLNHDCDSTADCLVKSDNSSCLNMLCSTSGKCASTACSSTSDCSQFGDGFTCVDGNCISYGCGQSSDCPSNMICGPDKKCTSQTCTGMFSCPNGMECKNTNGTRVCISNPGVVWKRVIFYIIVMLIVLTSVILLWVYRHSIAKWVHGQ